MIAAEVCIVCADRQNGCNGPCASLADPEKRDIIVHIENANRGEPTCPLKKHDNLDPLAPAPRPEPIKPIPRSEWRLMARNVSALAEPQDAGLGDVVKRILSMEDIKSHPIMLGHCAALLFAEFGLADVLAEIKNWKSGEAGCGGCDWRRKELNAKYPLTAKACGI